MASGLPAGVSNFNSQKSAGNAVPSFAEPFHNASLAPPSAAAPATAPSSQRRWIVLDGDGVAGVGNGDMMGTTDVWGVFGDIGRGLTGFMTAATDS